VRLDGNDIRLVRSTAQLEAELVATGLLGNRAALVAEVEAEVAQAVRFADASPYPADEELTQHVYA